MTIRILIIDDSPTMRAILMMRLSKEPDIEVAGTAATAAEGREMIKQLNPDVVTLDIEMPGMNGLDFLEKIMALRPTPVIIISGSTQEGNAVTARALALGAVDCYAKSDSTGGLPLDDQGRLAGLIREAAQVRFPARAPAVAASSLASRRSADGSRIPMPDRANVPSSGDMAGSAVASRIPADTGLIAIGSSTGGVEALQVLLRDFPEDCPPTVIVQHVNARFSAAIAQTLDGVCPARVVLGEPDIPLRRGHVYMAPGGDRHMMVGGSATHYIKFRRSDPVAGHVPSVDVLFSSAARVFGPRAIGILLTGMGSDGARGLLAMAKAGAHTIAQDEASCIVFGMPRAAISLGAAGVVAPIGRIAQHTFRKAA